MVFDHLQFVHSASVQPFVQPYTANVQPGTELYLLYGLHTLLYNIVTVWCTDVQALALDSAWPGSDAAAQREAAGSGRMYNIQW